jgi:hypothetical protein
LLASPDSAGVTGRVFTVRGGRIRILEGWQAGPSVDVGRRWEAAELGPVIADLVARARPDADLWGDVPGATT